MSQSNGGPPSAPPFSDCSIEFARLRRPWRRSVPTCGSLVAQRRKTRGLRRDGGLGAQRGGGGGAESGDCGGRRRLKEKSAAVHEGVVVWRVSVQGLGRSRPGRGRPGRRGSFSVRCPPGRRREARTRRVGLRDTVRSSHGSGARRSDSIARSGRRRGRRNASSPNPRRPCGLHR